VVPLFAYPIAESELGNIQSHPGFKQFVCVPSSPTSNPPKLKEVILLHTLPTVHNFKYLLVTSIMSPLIALDFRVVSLVTVNLSPYSNPLHLSMMYLSFVALAQLHQYLSSNEYLEY